MNFIAGPLRPGDVQKRVYEEPHAMIGRFICEDVMVLLIAIYRPSEVF